MERFISINALIVYALIFTFSSFTACLVMPEAKKAVPIEYFSVPTNRANRIAPASYGGNVSQYAGNYSSKNRRKASIRKVAGDCVPSVLDDTSQKKKNKIYVKKLKRKIKKFYQMDEEGQDDFLDKIVEEHKKTSQKKFRLGQAFGLKRGGRNKAIRQVVYEGLDSATRAQLFEFGGRLRVRMPYVTISF